MDDGRPGIELLRRVEATGKPVNGRHEHTPQFRLFAWNEIADKHALAANALFDHRQVIRRRMQSSVVVEMYVAGSRVISSAPLISSSSLNGIMPACAASLAKPKDILKLEHPDSYCRRRMHLPKIRINRFRLTPQKCL